MSTSKSKETTFHMRILRADLERWKAGAQKNGLTLSEFVRRKVNERPLKAVKLPYAAEYRLERKRLLEQAEQAERARIAEERNRGYRRREEADRLSREAGGCAKWFQSMSPAERAMWGDLKEDLLRVERLVQESDASWQRYQEQQGKTKTERECFGDLGDLGAIAEESTPKPPTPDSETDRIRAAIEQSIDDTFCNVSQSFHPTLSRASSADFSESHPLWALVHEGNTYRDGIGYSTV